MRLMGDVGLSVSPIRYVLSGVVRCGVGFEVKKKPLIFNYMALIIIGAILALRGCARHTPLSM